METNRHSAHLLCFMLSFLLCVQCLLNVGDDIFDIFDTY